MSGQGAPPRRSTGASSRPSSRPSSRTPSSRTPSSRTPSSGRRSGRTGARGLVGWTALLAAAAAGAAPPPRRAHTQAPRLGSYVETPAAEWPARELRPKGLRRSDLAAHGPTGKVGEVAILEGDDETVSGLDGALGLRFDAERNDLGRATARYAREVGDVPAVLVLFTTFSDHGAAGPAYFVPIHNEVSGTGLGPVDQRAAFGVERLMGVANLKRLDDHPAELVLPRLAHELAHAHLAYLSAWPSTATAAVDLTGRQHAHWHAALHSSASLMGGYAWRETSPGHFVVTARDQGFSDLDLYGLGLLGPSEVRSFFFVRDLRTLEGATLPPAAELRPGSLALGARLDLSIEDVIRAEGARAPDAGDAPHTTHTVFALLTAPGESATSTAVLALAERIDDLRPAIEGEWSRLTRGLGSVTTTREAVAEGSPRTDDGCTCTRRPRGAGHLAILVGLLAFAAWRRTPKGRSTPHVHTIEIGPARRTSTSQRSTARSTIHVPRPRWTQDPHAHAPRPRGGRDVRGSCACSCSVVVERGALSWSVERSSWSVERSSWGVERASWGVERASWGVKRASWRTARGAAQLT